MDSRHIVHPVDHVSARIQFIEGTVTGIDLTKKTVDVKRGRKEAIWPPSNIRRITSSSHLGRSPTSTIFPVWRKLPFR